MIIKKAAALIMTAATLFLFASCGNKSASGTTVTLPPTTLTELTTAAATEAATDSATEAKNESTTAASAQTTAAPPSTEGATTPTASPVAASTITHSRSSVYGEKSGTSATYTGLEPLPVRSFDVSDPENTAGLDCTRRGHAYGVAVNEQPHSISVNNAAYYSKYNAFTLDTSGARVIYLTFDCGYENGNTEQILNVLLEKEIPAAFFVTLPYLKSSPEIVTRMINEGHTVGNHSDTHPDFSAISRSEMAREIQTVDDYLRTNFGYSSPFFRFPQGACSDNSLELVASLGYTSVFWSSAYADWDTSQSKGKGYAFETVTSRLHPGCVQLLHVASKDNADALGDIIDYALSKGYTFKAL